MNINRRPMRYSHSEGHTDVCYSDDGKYIITCGMDGDVRVWCGLEDDDPSSQCVGEKAFAVAFKGNKIFVATDNNNVQAYTFPELEKDGIISHFTAPVTHISIANNGKKIVSGSCDMTIQIHDPSTNNFESLVGHSAPILGVALDPEMQYMTSSSCDGTIRVWCMETLKCVKIWSCVPVCNSFTMVKSLGRTSWHPSSGKFIAVPDGTNIDLYIKCSWEKIKSFSDAQIEKPFSIALFSPCGQLLVGSTVRGEICIWDVSSGATLSYTQHQKGYAICSMAWNPSGNGTIAFCDASGQLGTVEGCRVTTGSKLPLVEDANYEMTDVDLDEDGENVISLEKIKSSVSQPVNSAIELDLDDDLNTKGDGIESEASALEPTLKLQHPFQPSSSPIHLQHRYMVWNSVGIVRCFNTEEENSIDVEFHDSTFHHPMHMNNYLKHSLASLSENALVLSCESEDDSPSKVVCICLNSWDGSREWTVALPVGEEVLAVACSKHWVAAATDVRNLRIFTISGTQREIISLPGPVVCLAAYDSMLFVACYHGSALDFVLLCVERNYVQTMVSFQPMPLAPNSSLQWAGFSDEGSPCIMDSAGLLKMFSTQGYWLPLCDTQALCKGKSDHYFVLGVSERYQNIRCILCKGSHYPPTTPQPTVVELPMKIPLCEPDNEKSKLEESFLLNSTTFSSLDLITNLDVNHILDKEKVEKTIKETIIKLFALACKNDLDQRALDLCRMMPSTQIVELARKYASKVGKTQLVKRIDETILQNTFDSSHFREKNSRFMLNKNLSYHTPKEDKRKYETSENDSPASSSEVPNSVNKENVLLAIKQKMNTISNTPSCGSQKRVNPFKKTPKLNGSSVIGDGCFSQEEEEENSTTSSPSLSLVSPGITKVKQTGLWGKTPNSSLVGSKMTFVQWYEKEKESLKEEFPNEDPLSLCQIGMKRFKETVSKKSIDKSKESSQNSQEEVVNNNVTFQHEDRQQKCEDQKKKRKLEDEDRTEASSASKLSKFLFKK